MKKFLAAIAAFSAVLALSSCSKKAQADEFGWFSNFDDAKKAANDDNKQIILYFSERDTQNGDFDDKIFRTSEFKEKFSPEYVFCNLDFSTSRFDDVYQNEKTEISSDSESLDSKYEDSESENSESKDSNSETENSAKKRGSKETEKLQSQLSVDMALANVYAVQAFPAVYLVTKQGYMISPILVEEYYDIDDFQNEIAKTDERKQKVSGLLTTISTGKKEDVLSAIDELYTSTDDNYKFLLAELSEKYIKLDKKNESGKTVDHIFALANSRAQKALFEQDYDKAEKELVSPLNYKILTAEDRQQVYYSAGYFLAMSGSSNYDKMTEYFQKSYDEAPQSEYAETIQSALDAVAEQKSQSYNQ